MFLHVLESYTEKRCFSPIHCNSRIKFLRYTKQSIELKAKICNPREKLLTICEHNQTEGYELNQTKVKQPYRRICEHNRTKDM